MPRPYKRWYTTTEAAEKIGVNPSRLRQMAIAGDLPGAFKTPKGWLIPGRVVNLICRTPHTRGWQRGRRRA